MFMGGLALGSLIGARLAGRVKRPLLAYALVEAGVGLYALILPLLLARYPALNSFLWKAVGDHFVLLSILRFAATALALIVPTTLMGATLPLLSQYVSKRHSGIVGAAAVKQKRGDLACLATIESSSALPGSAPHMNYAHHDGSDARPLVTSPSLIDRAVVRTDPLQTSAPCVSLRDRVRGDEPEGTTIT